MATKLDNVSAPWPIQHGDHWPPRLRSGASADRAEVALHHSSVPDDEMGRQHKDGWTWVLSMLAERFARKA